MEVSAKDVGEKLRKTTNLQLFIFCCFTNECFMNGRSRIGTSSKVKTVKVECLVPLSTTFCIHCIVRFPLSYLLK